MDFRGPKRIRYIEFPLYTAEGTWLEARYVVTFKFYPLCNYYVYIKYYQFYLLLGLCKTWVSHVGHTPERYCPKQISTKGGEFSAFFQVKISKLMWEWNDGLSGRHLIEDWLWNCPLSLSAQFFITRDILLFYRTYVSAKAYSTLDWLTHLLRIREKLTSSCFYRILA